MSDKLRLRADLYVNNIREIPLDTLWEQGIRGILFDLDNTVTAWRSRQVNEAVVEWFSLLRERGFKLGIVSNSDPRRVRPVGELLGVWWIARAHKPHRRAFDRACRLLELAPEQAAMVGDQMFTDLLGANRAGLYTILTEIVHPREFWGTRYIMRTAERAAKKLLSSRGQ